jgi:hypothetical protein
VVSSYFPLGLSNQKPRLNSFFCAAFVDTPLRCPDAEMTSGSVVVVVTATVVGTLCADVQLPQAERIMQHVAIANELITLCLLIAVKVEVQTK